MMASQKVRPAALPCFFWISTYSMYVFALEKARRLAGQNFCLTISRSFVRLPMLSSERL